MTKHSSYNFYAPSAAKLLPLLFDSPHSGIALPADFAYQVTIAELKTGWDAYVDQLWHPATELGASLLSANASRMYIDLNRAPDDIDQSLLAEPWPTPLTPSPYTERGMGLLRRFALPGRPIYAQSLSVQAVQQRLDNYYHPYHLKLSQTLASLRQRFGSVWHIDCHSMKSRGNAMNIDADASRPDIVLGDADGSSSEPGFTACIAEKFQSLGYKVAINHPYKGGQCVRAYGNPAQHYHSLQIEINRHLYMNEVHFTKSANYNAFQADLQLVSRTITDYIQVQLR